MVFLDFGFLKIAHFGPLKFRTNLSKTSKIPDPVPVNFLNKIPFPVPVKISIGISVPIPVNFSMPVDLKRRWRRENLLIFKFQGLFQDKSLIWWG